jgi:hypothetical protein
MALVMGVVVLTTLAVGVLLASTTKHSAPRVVTIPVADRSAPASLVREAEAVGFRPNTEAGVGQIEGRPLTGPPRPAIETSSPGVGSPGLHARTPPAGEPRLTEGSKAVLLEPSPPGARTVPPRRRT